MGVVPPPGADRDKDHDEDDDGQKAQRVEHTGQLLSQAGEVWALAQGQQCSKQPADGEQEA